MKKLFLMLVVLFIALCLFVSCDDSSDKTAVSTWRATKIDDDDPFYDVDNYELVLYDDGTCTFVNNYIYKIDGVVDEEGTTIGEGTYSATSDTTGTYKWSYKDDGITVTINGSYIIDGNIIQIIHEHNENTITLILTKV